MEPNKNGIKKHKQNNGKRNCKEINVPSTTLRELLYMEMGLPGIVSNRAATKKERQSWKKAKGTHKGSCNEITDNISDAIGITVGGTKWGEKQTTKTKTKVKVETNK